VVHQPAPAPHRFRDQKWRNAAAIKASGGWKLNEFEIAHLGAGFARPSPPRRRCLGRVVVSRTGGRRRAWRAPRPVARSQRTCRPIENLQTLAAAPRFGPRVSGPAGPGAAQAAAPLGPPAQRASHQGSAGLLVLGIAAPGGGLWAASKGGLRPSIAAIETAMPSCSKRSTTGRRLTKTSSLNGTWGSQRPHLGLSVSLAVARKLVFRPGHRAIAPPGPSGWPRERCSVLWLDQQHPQANREVPGRSFSPGGRATDHPPHFPMAGQGAVEIEASASHAASRRELEL